MHSDTQTANPPVHPARRATLVAGIFYIATFVFSIPALALYDGVVNDPSFVLGAGNDQPVLWGGLIEIVTALTCIGTAVALYPVIRHHGHGRAIGFVASRTLEAAMIFTGVLAVLAVYTLRQDATAGTDTVALTTTASALVAVKDWTFLLGPGVMPAINALCFATIVYQSRLVPRWMPVLGLIGAPVLLASTTATMFGAFAQVSAIAIVSAVPIAVWEFAVGVQMIVKGFRHPRPNAKDVTVDPAARVALAEA